MTSLNQIGKQAQIAARQLAILDTASKNKGLIAMANANECQRSFLTA